MRTGDVRAQIPLKKSQTDEDEEGLQVFGNASGIASVGRKP